MPELQSTFKRFMFYGVSHHGLNIVTNILPQINSVPEMNGIHRLWSYSVLGFCIFLLVLRVILSLIVWIGALLTAHYPNYINFVIGFSVVFLSHHLSPQFPSGQKLLEIIINIIQYIRDGHRQIYKFLKPLNITMHLRHPIF